MFNYCKIRIWGFILTRNLRVYHRTFRGSGDIRPCKQLKQTKHMWLHEINKYLYESNIVKHTLEITRLTHYLYVFSIPLRSRITRE